MSASSPARFSHLQSTLRLLRYNGRNHFSTDEVYTLYNVIAPKNLQMTPCEMRTVLSRFPSPLGIKRDHREKRTGSTGAREVVIWTWR